MDLLRKAIRTQQNEGTFSLLKKGQKYTRDRFFTIPYHSIRAKFFDIGRIEVDGYEATFKVESYKESDITSTVREGGIMSDVLSRTNSDDVVYDIGAAVGTYSCLLGKTGAKVVAFEPVPMNAERLRENVSLNDVDVDVYEYALSDDNGAAELTLRRSVVGDAGHTLVTDSLMEGRRIQVELGRGDELVEEEDLPPPTALKIDVEGAEMDVLKGLESSIETSCRIIYVEVHPGKLESQGYETDDVKQFLTSRGFEVDILHERGTPFWRARAR